MNSRDEEFNVRLGPIRNRRGGRSFVDQMLRAPRKAGHDGLHTTGRGRGPRGMDIRRSGEAAPLSAHIAYLERDGVTRDGENARMFNAEEDLSDAAAPARRSHDDRHHFRFIVAPEDAAEMTDLKAFARDLVTQMERDLGTRLDWVAVDHWNTDNPHVHLLVRASRRMAPISSSLVATSATTCGRGPRNWSRSNSDASRNGRSIPPWLEPSPTRAPM